jgi:hypothetical protein
MNIFSSTPECLENGNGNHLRMLTGEGTATVRKYHHLDTHICASCLQGIPLAAA